MRSRKLFGFFPSLGSRVKACGLGQNEKTHFVRISVWQLLSKAFMVAAIAAFVAFHFIRDPEQSNDAGWKVWKELGDLVLHPSGMDEPMGWVAIASFLTASLLIVVSPFLGAVWLKSKMAWLPTVIFGGLSAASLSVAILFGRLAEERLIGWGLYVLMTAPILNFIGLLFARSGTPQLDKSQLAPPSLSEEI